MTTPQETPNSPTEPGEARNRRERRHGRQPARLLDYDDAAAYCGTTRRHMQRLVFERRIAFIKVGKLVRFDPADLDQFLDANRHPAGAA